MKLKLSKTNLNAAWAASFLDPALIRDSF